MPTSVCFTKKKKTSTELLLECGSAEVIMLERAVQQHKYET